MRAHTRRDPSATPLTISDPDWLTLSGRLTDQLPRLTGRKDLVVATQPGAGRGAPGVFIPDLAMIELDGRLFEGHPRTIRPNRARDRRRYPAAWGVFIHEAAHAAHSRWQPPPDSPPAATAAAMALEESRAEAAQVARQPSARRWLRASATKLILTDLPTIDSPWAAAQTAALLLTRVDAKILTEDEVAPLTAAITSQLGTQRLDKLREIWRKALATADDDGPGMLALGQAWCDVLGVRADQPPPPTSPPEHDGSGGPPIPSPVTVAAQAALREVAGNVARQAAEEEAAEAAAAARAKAKQAERDRQATAKATAKATFDGIGHGGPGSNGPATWRQRPPTEAEQAAARQLARRLRTARHRERTATTVTSQAPPGRLRMRAALAAQAQRAAGAQPTAEPWQRTVRANVPQPPLRIGIAADVSASMRRATKPLSSAAWIVAQAARRITDATAATVTFGDQVTPITRPGEAPGQVREFDAWDGTEQFCAAIDALDGALNLGRPGDAARLLVIVSDGHYGDKERTDGQQRIDRLRKAGCAVLWITCDKATAYPMTGTTSVNLHDPAAIGTVIAAAAQKALEQP